MTPPDSLAQTDQTTGNLPYTADSSEEGAETPSEVGLDRQRVALLQAIETELESVPDQVLERAQNIVNLALDVPSVLPGCSRNQAALALGVALGLALKTPVALSRVVFGMQSVVTADETET